MEKNYRKINVAEYVKELLEAGVKPFKAEKKGKIHARRGEVGEEVITWSVDENGNEVKEKVAKVTIDSQTGKPGFVVTKVDKSGMPVIDNNGHTNTWIIDDSVFVRKYTLDQEMGAGIYKPSAGEQIFIQIQEDVEIEQWGGKEKIARGGYINITDVNDMYGISARDYEDTYEALAEENTNTKKLS